MTKAKAALSEAQAALPGLQPGIALAALGYLCRQWFDEVRRLPGGELSSAEADRLCLACLVLAHEDAGLLESSLVSEVGECRALAKASNWNEFGEIPWLLVMSYLTERRADVWLLRRAQNLLGHHDSSIRQSFHYVAWMIRPDIEADAVRDTLLTNIADKLGSVIESAGLLAVLYPDKTILDAAADAFEPPEGFEEQYRERLGNIRRNQWNSFTNNLWQAENGCRKLIWDTVKGLQSQGKSSG